MANATFEVLALVTEVAKKNMAHMLATGKAFKITGFTVGNQGHDPVDPFNAKTPDINMITPVDETVYPPIQLGPGDIDESSGILNPTFTCVLQAGIGTGVVSSLYLYATVVYDPTTQLPPFTVKTGVARYVELPSAGNSVGDLIHVLEDGQDYYWNGTQWLPAHERFVFAATTMPQLIKVATQTDTYKVSVQL